MLIPIHPLPVMKIARSERLQASYYPVQAMFRSRWSGLVHGRVSRLAVAHFFEYMRVVMMRMLLGRNRFRLETLKAVLRAFTIEQIEPATRVQPDLEPAGASSPSAPFPTRLRGAMRWACVRFLARGLLPTVLETP